MTGWAHDETEAYTGPRRPLSADNWASDTYASPSCSAPASSWR
jgi:hypothetical protein